MEKSEWKAVLDGIRNCIKCQDLWSEEHTTEKSHPLTQGEQSARILVVSQDPSGKAWHSGVMFPKSGMDRFGNPTWENFAAELLGENMHLFTPRHFCWTQAANCHNARLQDRGVSWSAKVEMLKRCGQKWRQKILFRPDGDCRWQLIVVMGWAALAWIRDKPGKYSNLTDALQSSLRDPRRYFGDCDCFVIHNPSGSNRELNKPDVRELQRQAIEKIRQCVEETIQE